MQGATIYERRGKLFMHSSSQTSAGLWILTAPVLAIDKDDAGVVGQAVKRCLRSSLTGIAHPTSFRNLTDPLLALAGVRTFSAFAKATKCIEAEMEQDVITFIPTRNGGPREGFVHLPNGKSVSAASDEQVGSTALAVLAEAE